MSVLVVVALGSVAIPISVSVTAPVVVMTPIAVSAAVSISASVAVAVPVRVVARPTRVLVMMSIYGVSPCSANRSIGIRHHRRTPYTRMTVFGCGGHGLLTPIYDFVASTNWSLFNLPIGGFAEFLKRQPFRTAIHFWHSKSGEPGAVLPNPFS